MAIIGVPTTRISNQFVRERLLEQVQNDQAALFQLQNQLSSGHRLELPSDDPTSALNVISLQRMIERKIQAKSNLSINQSYLTGTDVALAGISGSLADVRAAALGAAGTVATDEQRRAAAQQVEQAIRQLMEAGNQKFHGRYLFAGSTTDVRPFQLAEAGFVEYVGNEAELFSYADVDALFETNVTGSRVFGAISEPVRGTADLDPVLTITTRLDDLRGGRGITAGSIAVSDGTTTSIVDLSQAETIGDVAAMIRANPPDGRTLDVEITWKGLVIQMDSAPGNLSIREVGDGNTAGELRILAEGGVGNDPIVGGDLDPALGKTTRLDDILGTRARAAVRFSGADNDILLEAQTRGADFNGVTITFVDDAAVTPGNEPVTYDAVAGAIEIRINENHSRAVHVVEAINAAQAAGIVPFTARLDPLDEELGGLGLVAASPLGQPSAVTAGGSGIEPDLDIGIQIRSGGENYTIDFSHAETVEDLLNAINGSGAGALATINARGNGIDVRSRLSGADFAIGENGGLAATRLGLRTFTSATRLEDLNFGRGVEDHQGVTSGGTDFTITRSDGVSLEIDIAGAATVGDVLTRINNHPDNLASGTPLVARLAAVGNGIELVDQSGGPGDLIVSPAPASSAATDLGLVPEDQEVAQVSGTGTLTLSGADVYMQETDGVFTALLRLQDALEENDLFGIERSIEMLDRRLTDINFSRAELGAKQQGLDAFQLRLDNEEVELQSTLSLEYDADIVKVISDLTARQLALQAGLQSAAKIYSLTLLDYL